MALLPYRRYYTSVRAITRVGNVLESHSDGFVVDTTDPSLAITSVGGEPLNSSVDVMFWIEPEYFSAAWVAGDPESGVEDVWYHMGTYPGRKETYGSSLFYMCIFSSNTRRPIIPLILLPLLFIFQLVFLPFFLLVVFFLEHYVVIPKSTHIINVELSYIILYIPQTRSDSQYSLHAMPYLTAGLKSKCS